MDDKLKNMVSNAKFGRLKPIRKHLSDSSRLSWPEDLNELDSVFQKLRCGLIDTSCFHLLQISLFSSLLLSLHHLDDRLKLWLENNLDIANLFSGIDMEDAFSFQWQSVPLMSVSHDGNKINYFMVGTGKRAEKRLDLNTAVWPEWFGQCLSSDAKQAVHDAFEIAEQSSGRQSQWYLFGMVPKVFEIIQGRSLAFPLALTARALLGNQKCCPGYIATGDLKVEQGKAVVEAVGDIALKWDTAKEQGFTLFLYPHSSAMGVRLPDGIKSIPVKTFESGWMWATLYSRDRVAALTSLETALQSPETFVAMSENLDVDCLEWSTGSELVRQYLKIISKDVYKIEKLGRKLKNCYARASGNFNRVAAMAALFGTPESIEAFGDISPVTALLWCSVHLALANHGGDLERAEYWCKQEMKYHDAALKETDGRKIVNQFVIRRSGIGNRHNRYDFRQSMPDELMTLLYQQEKINQATGCTVDYCIGSIYGTIAQNFAFCGPAFIKQTKQNISLAQAAFGNGKVASLRQDWFRQFSYLYFALLDCEKCCHLEAKEVLCQYLEIENVPMGITDTVSVSADNPYPLFALTRGLTDIPGIFSPAEHRRLADKIFQITDAMKVESFFKKPDEIHPWQLIIYNAGRLALQQDNLQQAYQIFIKTITLCQHGGETINAMTLLPLSQIHKLGQMNQGLEQSCSTVLGNIQTSSYINSSYFKPLTDTKDIATALNLVADHPERFFPFNYR